MKKHTPVSFKDQRLFGRQVIKEKVVSKMSSEPHQFAIFSKIPKILKCLELKANIFRAFVSLWYLPLVKIKKKKKKRDKGDMIQKFCMIWHGITTLKTWILQIQTITGKIKLIGYLILGEIKFWNLKNEDFEKKSPKSEKKIFRKRAQKVKKT